MYKSIFRFMFLMLIILSISLVVIGQSTTASISGMVTDQQQAAVPNATVLVRNTETGFSRTYKRMAKDVIISSIYPLVHMKLRLKPPTSQNMSKQALRSW